MKKILRFMLILISALSISFALASCGGDNGGDDTDNDTGASTEDTKVTYTVTAVDEEGAPLQGVKVEFMLGSIPMSLTTGTDGKVSQKSAKTVSAKIVSVPKGYAYNKLNQKLDFDSDGNLKITLTKLPPFIIKVVDQDGNPVAGIKVQMCDESGSCRSPKKTNDNGEASYPYEEGTFHAQLTVVEDQIFSELYPGYTVDNAGEYYNFEDNTVTIVITKIAK